MEKEGAGGAERRWRVMKFGGTSVADAGHWAVICTEVKAAADAGQNVLVVLSALAGVTNALTALCDAADSAERQRLLEDILQRHRSLMAALELEPGPRFRALYDELSGPATASLPLQTDAERAELLGFGERMSTALAPRIMARAGLEPVLQDARELLKSSGEHDRPLSASCDATVEPEMARSLAQQGGIHVTQGFLVGGPGGATWLLGRGGSDTSAATFAARLQAELEIWTDVPGIFSADPRLVPDARLLLDLSYSEAQELASMGAKVLHPPSVRICKEAGVPLRIRDTTRPAVLGTAVGPRSAATEARLKGIVHRGGITLVMMDNPSMWRQVGFLAAAFGVFRDHGLSVDLVSTSESSVTVSLDPGRHGAADRSVLDRLTADLGALCAVKVVTGCVSISLVGNQIRTILGRLSEALDVFQDRKVHMVTQSANDLNLTLVVDPADADRLVQHLHRLLVAPEAVPEHGFGDSWRELTGPVTPSGDGPWWHHAAAKLEGMSRDRGALYVYDLTTVRAAAGRLTGLAHVDRVLYAMKANNHPDVLRALHGVGVGFDCVSLAELEHLLAAVPNIEPTDILFTPNFAGRREYERAFDLGVRVTVDNAWPLTEWTDAFAGREVFLRLDLAFGHGHHSKVITSGHRSKFGIESAQLERLAAIAADHDIRVVGLHAHTGSGVHSADVWAEQLRRLLAARRLFPEVRFIDLGGGLGVPERPGQPTFDLAALDAGLGQVAGRGDVEVWIEPGRYLVAEAGVLVAPVTQVKHKGPQRYLGLATGMNSLIRPALYGAYHEIVNLSRLGQPARERYTVVGPICESGDVLGDGRFLPESTEGDIMLIANAGAYGRTMSSRYNLRAPAEEMVLGDG